MQSLLNKSPYAIVTTRSFNGAYPSTRNTDWKNESDLEVGEIARDEPSLATMPFIRPSNKDREGPVKFEWTALGRDGKFHDFFQVFRAGKNMCLPGPTAGRVMRALLSMSPGEIDQNLQIETSLSELAGLCCLQKGGRTYNQIRRAINRLKGVTIETNAFWNNAAEKYMEDSIIELFSSRHFDSESGGTKVDIRWTSEVTSIMSTWTKPLNLNHFFQLNTCLARKLYQICSLGIYQQGEMVEDLKILCHGQLGISQNREYPSKLKESLSSPIRSLREKNLIDVTIEKDEESPSIKSNWLVRARPMEGMLEIYEEIDDPQYWACHLANRGMLDLRDNPLEECREMVDKKGVPRVREVVKEFDRRRSPESDATPVRHAGWMYDVLKNDVALDNSSDEDEDSRDVHMVY